MTSTAIKNVLNSRARLGECPLWDADRQLLYWVDILNHRVHEFNPSTGNDRFFEVGDVVGPIALAGEHRLIMAQRDHIAFLDTQSGQVLPILVVEADKPNNRFNDGKCDRQGRFWFNSMSEDEEQAALYRYDPDGSLHLMETGLTIGNGLDWSLDNTTFYHTDSKPHLIYAYDFDANSGSIDNRRVLIDLSHETFEPDGLVVDSEGCIWSAMWNGWCVIRFDPDGNEMMRVDVPVQRPTCCTFGGEELTNLYVTTASVGLSQQDIQKSVEAGDLFCLKTDVSGRPAPAFAG
ncbi:SMP-30/gluconolactonase/LRE family protein [Thermocoleostomius sinensis]|uniref:SMP-30/gluconolactonase/LRE family protein n=1 Tax=Thermocoleostomius sinensis A174 TaxID=2016057 RepID=A0A9E8ZA37_9CYAN|nr:SMP-30/gluconolactonase/LRE family protein [Thermocoleostomius sinensis]WAL58077.1 SMP-30/gluconolactonase/LRE family protein [Thermocoleostomius sinensis A174]